MKSLDIQPIGLLRQNACMQEAGLAIKVKDPRGTVNNRQRKLEVHLASDR